MNFLQMFHQLLGQVRQVDERHLNMRWHSSKLLLVKTVLGAYMDLINDFLPLLHRGFRESYFCVKFW